MKTISGILLFVFLASGIYADNQVVGQKYKNRAIGNDYLGIVSLSVNRDGLKGVWSVSIKELVEPHRLESMAQTSILRPK
jgi:hypothetical protein